MITDKKRLIAELEKIIPDHALVEIERYVTEPGQSTHSMGYGGIPTNIALGSEITDEMKLIVKYYRGGVESGPY